MFTKKVPPWIPLGGFALACAAGCINAVGLLSLEHNAFSHMSGNVTLVGIELGRGDCVASIRVLLLVLCFFLGCVMSGLVIRESTLRLGRRYGVALALESVLLLLAAWCLRNGRPIGAGLATAACGLQNAIATAYSGAVIRTTHMTGIVTDLGLAVASWVRRGPVEWPRMRLYLTLLLGFFSGSGLGAIGFARFGYDTFLFPAALTGLSGIAHAAYRHRYERELAPAR